jgi:hypothetical protein
MNDLHKEEYRRQLTLFGQRLFSAVKNNITVQKLYPPFKNGISRINRKSGVSLANKRT